MRNIALEMAELSAKSAQRCDCVAKCARAEIKKAARE
jgi:hypothetical protein